MAEKNVLIIGYGSIGKRHAANLKALGIRPYVLTGHPDRAAFRFIDKLSSLKDKKIEFLIIASPTSDHAADLKRALPYLRYLKAVLIEKPVAASYKQALEINKIASRHKLSIFVGYNLRFLKAFDEIKAFIHRYRNNIRIIEIVAGQDLKKWRPQRKLESCYSAFRSRGGGVDLDLSHEVDYLLWLFGDKFSTRILRRYKVSSLEIDSPDLFKAVFAYKNSVVDLTLDYIRDPAERYLKIVCEDRPGLRYDFLGSRLTIGKKTTRFPANEISRSYKKMLNAFLGIDKKAGKTICSLGEALAVLKVLEV